MTLRILAVDPGESNGWAIMEYDPATGIKYLNAGTTKREDFYRQLDELLKDVHTIVAEDFTVRPNYAKSGAFDWDRMPACQVIGALNYLATTRDLNLVLQSSSTKPVGYAQLGEVYRKGAKGKHVYDALAHGTYFFVTRMRAVPPSVVKAAQQS